MISAPPSRKEIVGRTRTNYSQMRRKVQKEQCAEREFYCLTNERGVMSMISVDDIGCIPSKCIYLLIYVN